MLQSSLAQSRQRSLTWISETILKNSLTTPLTETSLLMSGSILNFINRNTCDSWIYLSIKVWGSCRLNEWIGGLFPHAQMTNEEHKIWRVITWNGKGWNEQYRNAEIMKTTQSDKKENYALMIYTTKSFMLQTYLWENMKQNWRHLKD